MILLGITVSTVLWANPANSYVWIVLGVTLALRRDRLLRRLSQGHAADPCRLLRQAPPRRSRSLVAAVACYCIVSLGREPFASSLTFPFFKDLLLPLGWFFLVVGAFVIVGAGNAVNLTDGLDGLAIVPVMIAALSFGLIAYLAGNARVRRLSADPLRAPAPASSRCCAAR